MQNEKHFFFHIEGMELKPGVHNVGCVMEIGGCKDCLIAAIAKTMLGCPGFTELLEEAAGAATEMKQQKESKIDPNKN